MKKRVYSVATRKHICSRVALISDLHSRDYRKSIDLIRSEKPDFILAAGDMFEAMTHGNFELNRNGFEFFREAVKIATVYYAPGNHEIGCCGRFTAESSEFSMHGKLLPREYTDILTALGVKILNGSYGDFGSVRIGGLASGLPNKDGIPETGWLAEFDNTDNFKILLSHHPEYFEKYISGYGIDLTVSGHAHGGQWRIFSQGIYAPGQGVFPKYTGGIHQNRLIISRGCSNPCAIPRFFNPCEIVIINIENRG